jgi:hypothetical protein
LSLRDFNFTQRRSFGYPPAPGSLLQRVSNHPHRLRIDRIESTQTRLMKSSYPLISVLFLLASFLNPSPIHAQVKAQPPLPPVEQPATASSATTPPAPRKRIIVATIPKSLDLKKLKSGDTFTALVSTTVDSYYLLGLYGASILVRVVEAQPQSDGNDSRLALRFEKAAPGSGNAAVLPLELEAVASPDSVTWSVPIAIVDRFPCDPKVDRDKCTKPYDDDDSVESRLSTFQLLLCHTKKQHGNTGPQNDCVYTSEAHGIYGYPDLSLLPPTAENTSGLTIVAPRKKVKLAEGTLLILSGPDVKAALRQP